MLDRACLLQKEQKFFWTRTVTPAFQIFQRMLVRIRLALHLKLPVEGAGWWLAYK
jgi:hypothetical protein